MRIIRILVLVFGLTSTLAAQQTNIGTPMIQRYSRLDYQGGTQNWGFVQNEQGIVFVANNEGVLEFNGQEWTKHPLPNQTIVRSVALDESDRLFAGGQDEVGYFRADESGHLQFHSLKPLIPEAARRFEDVWDMLALPEGVFFRASDNIYHFHQGRIRVLSIGKPIVFLGGWSGNILIQDADGKLLKFSKDRFIPLSNSSGSLRAGITEVLPYHRDTILFATESQGIYYYTERGTGSWEIPDQGYLLQNRIQSASLLSGGRLALATALGGLLILDPDRKARFLLEKSDGLQNNNIRAVFHDADHHLWLGLDNGIDYVVVGSPFTTLVPDGLLEGTAYSAIVHQGNVYFGTSNGLFYTPWQKRYNPFTKNERFRKVSNTNGQVWGLGQINDELFLGHHEGGFIVEGGAARRISPEMGYWMFLPLLENSQSMAGGNYYGISLYQKLQNGSWAFRTKVPGLFESSRILAKGTDGAIWMSHPYRGVFRIEPDSGLVRFFGEAHGLPSDLQNHVFSINKEILVAAREGIYRFDPSENRFFAHEIYNELLGAQSNSL